MDPGLLRARVTTAAMVRARNAGAPGLERPPDEIRRRGSSGSGSFAVSPGMTVADARSRAIGIVRNVATRRSRHGAIGHRRCGQEIGDAARRQLQRFRRRAHLGSKGQVDSAAKQQASTGD